MAKLRLHKFLTLLVVAVILLSGCVTIGLSSGYCSSANAFITSPAVAASIRGNTVRLQVPYETWTIYAEAIRMAGGEIFNDGRANLILYTESQEGSANDAYYVVPLMPQSFFKLTIKLEKLAERKVAHWGEGIGFYNPSNYHDRHCAMVTAATRAIRNLH